jgi:hypothetical protein
MRRNLLSLLALLVAIIAPSNAQTLNTPPTKSDLHLQISLKTVAAVLDQPSLSPKQVILTAQGHRIPVRLNEDYATHLLILFVTGSPRLTPAKITGPLSHLLQAGWQISLFPVNGCPTPYETAKDKLEQDLAAFPSKPCRPGKAMQHLATFAGRRVLFLVGPDRYTRFPFYDAKRLMLPTIYLVDGGVQADAPTSGRGSDSNADIQPQTIDSGAQYGLINEFDLKQAANDALHAKANFYDFILNSPTPPAGPIRLSLRLSFGSGDAQLSSEPSQSDLNSTRTAARIPLVSALSP